MHVRAYPIFKPQAEYNNSFLSWVQLVWIQFSASLDRLPYQAERTQSALQFTPVGGGVYVNSFLFPKNFLTQSWPISTLNWQLFLSDFFSHIHKL